MRTALDSSVLLDVLAADATFGDRSREALRAAYNSGALLACDVVWAEVRAHFRSEESFSEALTLLGVRFDQISHDAARLAGKLWREHRAKNPSARDRLIPDFLVGAHARLQSDALLSRDRGFYRRYFSGLRVIDPSHD